jgi:HSP20 family protein
MDRWFGGAGLGSFGAGGAEGAGLSRGWAPQIDVWEQDDQFIVRADVPGVEPEDLELYCTEDSLILRGESRSSEEREERGYHRRERRYGRFERVVPLPAQVDRDKIQASFRNGVLEVKLPCTEASSRRMQRIPIQGARSLAGAKGGEAGEQPRAQEGGEVNREGGKGSPQGKA